MSFSSCDIRSYDERWRGSDGSSVSFLCVMMEVLLTASSEGNGSYQVEAQIMKVSVSWSGGVLRSRAGLYVPGGSATPTTMLGVSNSMGPVKHLSSPVLLEIIVVSQMKV